MSEPTQSLFRREVFDAKTDQWIGQVTLIRPTSFAFLTGCVALAVCVLLAFLFWGEYTRKTKAIGYLVPKEGILKIVPQQGGIVSALPLREGQRVESGQLLAVLNVDRITASGDLSAEVNKQIAARQALMLQERSKVELLYSQQLQTQRTRLSSLQGELAQIESSIRLQNGRAKIAETILNTQRKLHADRFISDVALQLKEQEYLNELATLETLGRSKSTLLREIENVNAETRSIPLRRDNELSMVERNLASLQQDSVEMEARKEIRIVAPVAGTVTAISSTVGKVAVAGQPMLSVVPNSASLHAEVYIPARAAGFIQPGMRTLLQYQAFPYQKFGTHEGSIESVSRTAIPANELPFPAPQGELYYIAHVSLAKQTVTAYGRQESLQSGMLLDANILLDRRTLFEWMFEPLYAISGRWVN